MRHLSCVSFFFFNDTATTEIYTLSLHDALPISKVHERFLRGDCKLLIEGGRRRRWRMRVERHLEHRGDAASRRPARSEEHTSELQSPCNLVCRLLLEKKN